MMSLNDQLDDLIKYWFAEDIGDGDHTSLSSIPETAMGKSRLIIKETGVLAGVEVAKRIFAAFDPELKMTQYLNDGDEVKPGDIAFDVEGKVLSLLQTERLMLNIMQRMSGVATVTRKYAKCLEGLKTKVLDTRKTTPGLRLLEKQAVKIGGGTNHRIGLFDMILLKDNHVDFAGGIENAITRAKEFMDMYNSGVSRGRQFMVVQIETEGNPGPEVIVNRAENFDKKFNYYIKIRRCDYGTSKKSKEKV